MFEAFPKLGRISKMAVVTEKIDGTNAQIHIVPIADLDGNDESPVIATVDGHCIYAGSRNRYLTIHDDNFGFANWVYQNREDLIKLGEGRHFGEWWGSGIGPRKYPIEGRRFSLFNTARWNDNNPNRPSCCHVVPVVGNYTLDTLDDAMLLLKEKGSFAVPGFMNPEGIVVYNDRTLYKKTFEFDKGKWTEKSSEAVEGVRAWA